MSEDEDGVDYRQRVGIVSGYFNPLHRGHIEYFQVAKGLSTVLFAIINNDIQVVAKGSSPFMDQDHRAFIVGALKQIDATFISIDENLSVSRSLEYMRNTIIESFGEKVEIVFFNSGDRNTENLNGEEQEVCDRLGIKQVFLDLPKKYHSSEFRGEN